MTLKYGLAVEKWDEAVAEIRAILQQAARERRYLTYGEVTQAMLSVRAHPGAMCSQRCCARRVIRKSARRAFNFARWWWPKRQAGRARATSA